MLSQLAAVFQNSYTVNDDIHFMDLFVENEKLIINDTNKFDFALNVTSKTNNHTNIEILDQFMKIHVQSHSTGYIKNNS